MTKHTVMHTDMNQDAAVIRAMIHGWAEAIRAGDSDRLTAEFAPDLLQFDVVGPLQSIGRDAAKERARQWLASFAGPVEYNIRDLTVETGERIAFSHSLNQVRATTNDGKAIEMWWRSTIGFRQINGKWTVVHMHGSVPFNPGDGKASLDLKP